MSLLHEAEVFDNEEVDPDEETATGVAVSQELLNELVKIVENETQKDVWQKWLLLVSAVIRQGLPQDTTEEDVELAAKFLGVKLYVQSSDNNTSGQPTVQQSGDR